MKNLFNDSDNLTKPKQLLRDESKHLYKSCDSCSGGDCNECPLKYKTEGDMEIIQNKYSAAIQSYEKGVNKFPDFLELWNNLAPAYGMIGEYEKALAAFDKAILGDPKYGKALFGKAVTLNNIQRYQEGLDLCNKILDLYDNPETKKLKNDIQRNLSLSAGKNSSKKI